MTYGCVADSNHMQSLDGAATSHSAELVRGKFLTSEGPLIRPSATFFPRGEGLRGEIQRTYSGSW